MYVEDQGEGHPAGDGRAPVAAFSGVSVLAAFQEVTGMSGHCVEEVSHCDIHKRVFLARASGVREVQDAAQQR